VILGVETINVSHCTTAVIVEFAESEFTVFESEPEIMITLEIRHPALTEFTVIVVALPDTADGKEFGIYYGTYYILPFKLLILQLAIQL